MVQDRRSFLTAVGVVGASTLASGCSSPEDESSSTTGNRPTTADQTQPPDTGTTVQNTQSMEAPRSAAHHDPDDGFAEMAPWLDDDTSVYTVEEPTREALVEALSQSGPRVVVFETSGTIDLDGKWIRLTNDNCWIAGQTAPSPGITIVRGRFRIAADNCVVQHLRFRPGDEGGGDPGSLDALNTDTDTSNNVIDHCSTSWSTDEVLSVGYQTDRTTVTNCLIYEPLVNSIHPKGAHGYCTLVGDGAERVFYGGNVLAHSSARNPRLKTKTRSAVVNNVMYDVDEATNLDDDTVATIIGNAYLDIDVNDAAIEGGRARVADNYTDPETRVTKNVYNLSLSPETAWTDTIADPLTGEETVAHNLTHAGARPADRTENDERIVQEVRDRTGQWIDSQEEVGGYPDLSVNSHSLDVPDTGLRAWLRQQALAVEQ